MKVSYSYGKYSVTRVGAVGTAEGTPVHDVPLEALWMLWRQLGIPVLAGLCCDSAACDQYCH